MSPARATSAATSPPTGDPVALLASMVLEDGQLWGQTAAPFQWEDAEAVLLGTAPSDPRMHWLGRPRGGRKTSDAGGFLLASLLSQAPDRSVSHGFARDKDQAALQLDVIRGLAARSGLLTLLDFGSWGVTSKASGARLVIESADAASALGATPFLVVVDELAAWPSTRESASLWQAIVSGMPKRRDSRLVCITTAGAPGSMAAGILAGARTSKRWRVGDFVGVLPWSDADDLAEQKRLLPESVYLRLHENRWTSSEDRLVSASDLAACVTLDGPQEYTGRHRHVVAVDVGLKNDRTVILVAHAEPEPTGGPRVVLDRLTVMGGTRAKPVQLADVEQAVEQSSRAFGSAKIRVDPWQAIGTSQRLRAKGLTVEEWSFTAQSVGRLGATLHRMLRDHKIALPDDRELLDELATVRLRESSPGVLRLDHDSNGHDDQAVALGLAVLALVENFQAGGGSFSNPREVYAQMKAREAAAGGPGMGSGLLNSAYAARPIRGAPAAVHGAARAQTPAQRAYGIGLPVEGSENDPSRVMKA